MYPSSYEGFGLPILEAMGCKTPVITSNTSSIPEVANDSAVLIDPFDKSALSEAMLKLLNSPSLLAEYGEKGYKIVLTLLGVILPNLLLQLTMTY